MSTPSARAARYRSRARSGVRRAVGEVDRGVDCGIDIVVDRGEEGLISDTTIDQPARLVNTPISKSRSLMSRQTDSSRAR